MSASLRRSRLLRLAGAFLLAICSAPALAQKNAVALDAGKATVRTTTCAASATSGALTAGAVRRDCEDTPELVFVPAGIFEMGDRLGNGYPYEKPVHKVRVDAFLLGRYEVTIGEWNACVAARACPDLDLRDSNLRHPVSFVSWDEAKTYLAWLSRRTGRPYRLPSEAEWEYATRAGSEMQYTWGNNEISICRYANVLDLSGSAQHPDWTWAQDCDDGYAELAPVGSFPANAWGLYDMLGNVWEWVEDCWHGDYEGAPATAVAWEEDTCSKRVNRGGGWENHARTVRVSARDGDIHSGRSEGLGFRVARGVIYAGPSPTPSTAAAPAAPAPPSAQP